MTAENIKNINKGGDTLVKIQKIKNDNANVIRLTSENVTLEKLLFVKEINRDLLSVKDENEKTLFRIDIAGDESYANEKGMVLCKLDEETASKPINLLVAVMTHPALVNYTVTQIKKYIEIIFENIVNYITEIEKAEKEIETI